MFLHEKNVCEENDRISSKWNKERKVTQKIAHEMLGRKRRRVYPKGKASHIFFCFETYLYARIWGQHLFKAYFSKYYRSPSHTFSSKLSRNIRISNRSMHTSGSFEKYGVLYENSMLSEEFKGLDLSKNKLISLIQEWDNNRESTAAFMQTFVQNSH